MRNISEKVVEKIKIRFMFHNFFPSHVVSFMRQCGKML